MTDADTTHPLDALLSPDAPPKLNMPETVLACPPCRAQAMAGGLYRPVVGLTVASAPPGSAALLGAGPCEVCGVRQATAKLEKRSDEEVASEAAAARMFPSVKIDGIETDALPDVSEAGGLSGDAAAQLDASDDSPAPALSSDPNPPPDASPRVYKHTYLVCGDCRTFLEKGGGKLSTSVTGIGLGKTCETHAHFFEGLHLLGYASSPQATSAVESDLDITLPRPPPETPAIATAKKWGDVSSEFQAQPVPAIIDHVVLSVATQLAAAVVGADVTRLAEPSTAIASVILARQLIDAATTKE